MTNKIQSNEIDDLYRTYSMYIITERAIPHVTDGLKSGGRRVLWKARDGKKIKSATLAGSAMSIHPHAAPEGSINTLTGFYINNVPLFQGYGAFGTMLEPSEFSAARYTYVRTSEFTKDVVFADMSILPMIDNYDNTEMEPKHFLPLVPVVLLNPQSGSAVGYASSILSRSLGDILKSQISYLKTGKFKEVNPALEITNSYCVGREIHKTNGKTLYKFRGEYTKTSATSLKITNLPMTATHAKFMASLYALEDKDDRIISIEDNSNDVYDIEIKFKKGFLSSKTEDEIFKYLSLERSVSENFNVIDFNSTSIFSATYEDVIQDFTDWRLSWYKTRYERLKKLLEEDIQRYKDIILAINKNVGSYAKKMKSRAELKELLDEFGIINLDYIADLPMYRYTEEEKEKTKTKLKDALKLLKEYNKIIKSDQLRKDIYIDELKVIQTNEKRGKYATKIED